MVFLYCILGLQLVTKPVIIGFIILKHKKRHLISQAPVVLKKWLFFKITNSSLTELTIRLIDTSIRYFRLKINYLLLLFIKVTYRVVYVSINYF